MTYVMMSARSMHAQPTLTLASSEHPFSKYDQGKCHIRLKPSMMPDHNRALPCQRCTGQSEEVYGTPAVVYHGRSGVG